MNKDTVVASVIGFGLGLVAAIALWVVPRILPKTLPKLTEKAEIVQEEKSSPQTVGSFSINSPSDGEIVSDKNIKITGTSANDSLVIVATSSTSSAIVPGNDGTFSAQVELAEGSNEVVVTSYLKDKTDTKKMNIFFYAENI